MQDKDPKDTGKIAGLEAELASIRAERDAFAERLNVITERAAILHATLESAVDGVLAVDEEGKVLYSNRIFANMWRIPPDLIEAADDNELLNYVLEQLVNPDAFLARVRELYQSIRSDCDILHFRDGRVFERHSKPLVRKDQVLGRVWCFRDISDRHRTV
jgi:two-component system, sensor histidine kinase and response regulator